MKNTHIVVTVIGFLVFALSGFEYPAVYSGQDRYSADSLPFDSTRFSVEVLAGDMNEPMELAIAPDSRVFWVERHGELNQYNPRTKQTKLITKLPVRYRSEDGLLGITLDPNFGQNGWVYLYYSQLEPVNGQAVQVLARFTLQDEQLVSDSKKVFLTIPVLPDNVSHSGGSLTFDGHGNLYLSTGDNTNPFGSDGYAPIDERPDRLNFDAQKSSANTNDLRGKIIRIHPEPDGSYTIPAGNLFSNGDPRRTRPEIYVMGCRNPFRIAVDKKSGFLYWGEVGPDAGRDSVNRGPRGHDEINQARQAGNFGWPYFVGNSKPYHNFDFVTGTSGPRFDPAQPINDSPNSTGLHELPPAQNAFIWYPYLESPEFPELGTGGRNAMAGPVYHAADYANSDVRLPDYYDGKLLIYEWMRNWIKAVTLKPNGDLERIESFLPGQKFVKPMDMALGPDGSLYVLEYGEYWRARNDDARLVRITYNRRNRPPVVALQANKTVGAAPLTVQFSTTGTFDHDKRDKLSYAWYFGPSNTPQARVANPTFTFTKPGLYTCRVVVTDEAGGQTEQFVPVRVGNEPPNLAVNWSGNRSFYFADQESIAYKVTAKDREDGPTLDPKRLRLTFDYVQDTEDLINVGHQPEQESPLVGKALIEKSDCRACHALQKQSVGPPYEAVAKRYRADEGAVTRLSQKIINGGGGVWGESMMSAHPQVSTDDAARMVRYILSLSNQPKSLPATGTLTLIRPAPETDLARTGRYILTAEYTDAPKLPVGANTVREVITLRHPHLMAASADVVDRVARRNGTKNQTTRFNDQGANLLFRNLDLSGIRQITLRWWSSKIDGAWQLRAGSSTGPLIAEVPFEHAKDAVEKTISLQPKNHPVDVYVVLKATQGKPDIWNGPELEWLRVQR